jgi:Putative auto-transporter adhesin, head GIN domain
MIMKKIILLFAFLVTFISCEKPSECIESFGQIVIKDIPVQPFLKITIHKGIEVVITQGSEYKVQIQAGENFIDNIKVKQIGTELDFSDNTSCNWVREYGQTKVLITAPNLEDIYSKTDRNISSNGILTFPTLRLYAFDTDGDGLDGAGTGDFFINVNNSQLVVQANNVARFYLSGATDQALLSLYFGDGRIEAQNLIAKNCNVYHRGTNDIFVFPTDNLTGNLFSTGNLISNNHPTNTPTVIQHYTGQLLYN